MVRIKKNKCPNAHIFACTHKRTYGYAYTHIQAHTRRYRQNFTIIYNKPTHIDIGWQKSASAKTKSVYQNKLLLLNKLYFKKSYACNTNLYKWHEQFSGSKI